MSLSPEPFCLVLHFTLFKLSSDEATDETSGNKDKQMILPSAKKILYLKGKSN